MDLEKKGLLLVLATAFISGISIFINSYGVKGFDSSVYTFAKNVTVALMLFCVIFLMYRWQAFKQVSKKHWMQLALIGFVGGSVPFLLYFKGLQMTTGALAGFIHKTIFLYVTILALIFLKEKISKGLFIGMAMLLLGNYLLLKPDFSLSIGHLYIVIATILWAAENTYAKRVLKEVSGTTVAFGRMFFGSLFIFVFLLFTDKTPMLFTLTNQHYLWIAITSLLLFFYVFTFYNGLSSINVSTAAALLTLGSPITTLLDFAFKGKPLVVSQAYGIIFILAGIISVLWLSSFINYFSKVLRREHHERH